MINPDEMAEMFEKVLEDKKERVSIIYDEIERLENDLILLDIGSKSYSNIRAKIKALESEQIILLEEIKSKFITNV